MFASIGCQHCDHIYKRVIKRKGLMTKYLAFGLLSVFFMQCPAKNDSRSFKSEVFTSSDGHELR